MDQKDWTRLHYYELKKEFDQSNRVEDEVSGECESCSGRGVFRNEFDNLEECEFCCGSGTITLSKDELFDEFCKDMYSNQRLDDMTRFINYERLMELTKT